MDNQLTEKIKLLSKSLAPGLIEIERQFHRYPELSGKETMTTASIRAWLKEEGIAEQHLDIPTGLVGVISGTSGQALARQKARLSLFARIIDALPIEEQTGLPFASEVKVVNACLWPRFPCSRTPGAGMILSRIREELPGPFKLFFQPQRRNTFRSPAVD
jgi:metal-dependent amidase/aminoacylase/carboxypeptidase family protein